MEPTTEAVVAINDRDESLSIKAQVAKLEAAGLETTEENIFIVAACGDKGLNYLKGDRPNGIRYKEAAKPKSASGAAAYTATVDGRAVVVEVGANGNEYTATVNGKTFKVAVAEGKAEVKAAAPAASGAGADLVAPLPGTVTKIVAAAGTQVNAGDTVLVIEAMKMETEIKADNAGTVKELCVAQGAVVAAGDKLAVIG
jgi:pyruvate carboxylase subunit B